jgi:hypothetical protein
MARHHALLNTAGERLEVYNENLSEYFSTIEDVCESRNCVSFVVKQKLQDVIKFQKQERIRVEYQYSKFDYSQNESKKIFFLSSNFCDLL